MIIDIDNQINYDSYLLLIHAKFFMRKNISYYLLNFIKFIKFFFRFSFDVKKIENPSKTKRRANLFFIYMNRYVQKRLLRKKRDQYIFIYTYIYVHIYIHKYIYINAWIAEWPASWDERIDGSMIWKEHMPSLPSHVIIDFYLKMEKPQKTDII